MENIPGQRELNILYHVIASPFWLSATIVSHVSKVADNQNGVGQGFWWSCCILHLPEMWEQAGVPKRVSITSGCGDRGHPKRGEGQCLPSPSWAWILMEGSSFTNAHERSRWTDPNSSISCQPTPLHSFVCSDDSLRSSNVLSKLRAKSFLKRSNQKLLATN